MALKKLYKIMIEDAVGHQDYPNVESWSWDDLQSTTYLTMIFANGHILKLNDFGIRKIFILPMGQELISE